LPAELKNTSLTVRQLDQTAKHAIMRHNFSVLRLRETQNNDQSNLVSGRIADFSFAFARWQHKTDGLAALYVSAGGSTIRSRLLLGSGTPSYTKCHLIVPAKWHLNPSNGLTRAHECYRQRQTDHATKKCVVIGGIAWAARAIRSRLITLN